MSKRSCLEGRRVREFDCDDSDNGDSNGSGRERDQFGPFLPSHRSLTSDNISLSHSTDVICGQKSSIGPNVPPEFPTKTVKNEKAKTDSLKEQHSDEDEDEDAYAYGPTMPPSFEKTQAIECDDTVIGPLPNESSEDAVLAFEQRLAGYKARNAAIKGQSKREPWMTELPEKLTNYGLGARTFQKSSAPLMSQKDKHLWTDTPADRLKRIANGEGEANDSDPATSKEKFERASLAVRDEHLAEKAEKLNASRQKDSLLEMHTRKRKQHSEKSNEATEERRPFDREKDMQTKGFGPRSANELKERVGQLSSRFGHGNAQKFL